ncbi:hypothetical protein H2203_007496 [Taxawa tesnikishii (nom. ined.)]|nr:hypothetical protein H2203_007496 [Dothideales sp. JES 119]
MPDATVPTYVCHTNGWSKETRSHPVLDWMEKFTKAFEARDHNLLKYPFDYMTNSHDRSNNRGPRESLPAVLESYAPFPRFEHRPQAIMIAEVEEGKRWEMMGQGELGVDVPGELVDGQTKVKDRGDGEWDAVLGCAFVFYFVKDENGIGGFKLDGMRAFVDPTPAVKIMIQRGVMSPEQLLK